MTPFSLFPRIFGLLLTLGFCLAHLTIRSQSFSPTNFPGLQLWVHTDAGVQVDPQNRVLVWLDQSDFHRPLVEVDELGRPILVPNALNGHGVVRFDGSDDSLNVFPFFQVDFRECAVFFVFKSYTEIPGRGLLSWRFHWFGGENSDIGTNSFLFALNSPGGLALGGPGASIDTSRIDTSAYYVTSFGAAPDLFLRRDGELIQSRPIPERRIFLDSLAFGARQANNGVQTSPPRFARIDVAEILIYNTHLTLTQIQTIETYLAEKYDLIPGPLALLKARRSYRDHGRITVRFSEPPQLASALMAENYLIDSAASISQVEPGATPDTFILTSGFPLEAPTEYKLEVRRILDGSGRRMRLANSITNVDLGPILPVDFSATARGIEDNFEGEQRHSQWEPAGAGGDPFTFRKGLLQAGAAEGSGPSRLFLTGNYATADQEILARLQWVTLQETNPGAGVVVSTGEDGVGIKLTWEDPGKSVLTVAGQKTPLPASFDWQSNAWHWVRLKHEPAARRVFASVWRADNDTPEPTATVLTYEPTAGPFSGRSGLLSSASVGGNLQVDYLLVKSPDFPELTPALIPPPPILNFRRSFEGLDLFWSIDPPAYDLYSADFLVDPVWNLPLESANLEGDMKRVTVPPESPLRFFQLQTY